MENRIWEKDFADLLLTYADYSPKKRNTVLKRVKKRYHDKAEGIALNDYIQIFSLLIHIDDVDKVRSLKLSIRDMVRMYSVGVDFLGD